MSVYRMTLRFNLEDAQERGAVEYLQKLRHGNGNRFVVGAVLARIQAEKADPVDLTLLNSIRRIFREEMRMLPPTQEITVPALPAEEQEDQSVLDDLELFG